MNTETPFTWCSCVVFYALLPTPPIEDYPISQSKVCAFALLNCMQRAYTVLYIVSHDRDKWVH